MIVLVTSMVLVGAAVAQTSKGILAGVVRDSTGAVIANATITAVNEESGETRETRSLGDGAYRIEALTAGRYKITSSQSGFNVSQASGLNVRPSIVTSYDILLNTGSASATVTVEATSAGINTVNGQLAGVVGREELKFLPIFSLNPIDLATTVAGVQIVSQGAGFSNGTNIQVNGARPRANNFLLDGQEINDVGIGGQAFQPQIPDIFQSETVITNNASAEYGRAGGAVVNMITKAGLNQFHGTVFERYDGSGLNALDGVTRQGKVSGTPPPGYVPPVKARFDQHIYGFTFGGPIIKDKLFAFGALQISRLYGKETPSRLELPDQNGYNVLQQIGGPQVALLDSYLSNGDYLKSYVAFPGSGTVSTINVGPQPGCPASGCIVTTGYFQRQNADQSNPDTQWTYRVDFNPREKDNFSFRYLHDRQSLTPDFFNNGSALVGFDTQQGGPTELGAGNWTHVFTPNIVNELRGSEARLGFTFSPTAATLANPLNALSTLNIANIAVDSDGASSLGPNQNFPQGRHEDLYQLQDTVGITKGRHSLRVGFDIGRIIETDIVQLNAKGTLTFNKGGTYISALGNFLQNQLGPSGTATKTFGNTRIDPHGWRSGVFAQDDIKLSGDLTVNVGIRYDYLSNPANSLQFPGVDPTNIYQPINTVVKVNNDKNNIAPRIGFAYSPHTGGFLGDGKNVLRGGFGIFYDSTFSNIVTNSAASSPNAVSGTLTSTTGNGLANATGLIGSISPNLSAQSSVTSEVNNAVNPVTYQYNLGVERQVTGATSIAVRYVGSLGKKLFANQQYNYFANGARLNPNRGVIIARGNFAGSNYNGVQVEGTHAFSHGFQINANYTYSKNLDNGSEIFAATGVQTSYTADLSPQGRRQDYANSGYDHRHYVSVSYVWSPAGFRSDNFAANALLGLFTRHWTLSGVEQFQSGTYTSFNAAGLDTNGDGSAANDRPMLGNRSAPLDTGGIDGGLIDATPGVYYDIANALNTTGNLIPVDPGTVHWLVPYGPQNQFLRQEIGRNSFSNPGTTRNDIALEKGIGLSYLHFERGRLILRGEVQNIGNHNDVGILDTNVLDIGSGNYLNTSNARQPGNSGGPSPGGRQIVLWGKVTF
ncbi:carboxypeptidase regulatory-like domain-containing protein [Granulicella sp. dw_53]|uniref:TonB-dependent receptor n=1 Tax=Granulicella sp. dw_53 TaxID=2719792 RepID=UPI001BD5CE32|nr:carboxypeptidase regulatory-like domain-containing protein [Granulicella sp. dw_53]